MPDNDDYDDAALDMLLEMLAENPDAENAGLECPACGIAVEVPVVEVRTLREAMSTHRRLCPAQ